jgi:hypothetical protein
MRPGKRGRLATRIVMAVAAGAVAIGGLWAVLLSTDSSGTNTADDVIWSYSSNH